MIPRFRQARIFVQLAAAPWVNTDVPSRSWHYRCFPGQGEFAMPGFTGAALDAGCTGLLPGDAHRVALFDSPPPPVPSGWPFIEFAVDLATAGR